MCAPGWEGTHCEQPIDMCFQLPCFPGVKCTNVFTPKPEPKCDPCPLGLEGDGRACTGMILDTIMIQFDFIQTFPYKQDGFDLDLAFVVSCIFLIFA